MVVCVVDMRVSFFLSVVLFAFVVFSIRRLHCSTRMQHLHILLILLLLRLLLNIHMLQNNLCVSNVCVCVCVFLLHNVACDVRCLVGCARVRQLREFVGM